MTGAGNDFILVDNRISEYTLDWVKLCPVLCDRRFGIGADGLIVLEGSSIASVKMLYFNADGSYGGMCGNGGRCAARFVMQNLDTDIITIESLDFIYNARHNGENISLRMKDPKDLKKNIRIKINSDTVILHYVDTGAPHAVAVIDELPENLKKQIDSGGISEIGKSIRFSNVFSPLGTNVDFIQIGKSQHIYMRTYERGVEGETLACGTGSVASAVISNFLYNLNSPIKVITRSNKELEVSFSVSDGIYTDVVLTGPAVQVFTGIIDWNPVQFKLL